jgi:hypothetical protein
VEFAVQPFAEGVVGRQRVAGRQHVRQLADLDDCSFDCGLLIGQRFADRPSDMIDMCVRVGRSRQRRAACCTPARSPGDVTKRLGSAPHTRSCAE